MCKKNKQSFVELKRDSALKVIQKWEEELEKEKDNESRRWNDNEFKKDK